eukprot:scaffold55558_cov21-Tisochrysis_lutea.AAC.4
MASQAGSGQKCDRRIHLPAWTCEHVIWRCEKRAHEAGASARDLMETACKCSTEQTSRVG